ncbi:Adenylate cyclase type 7, partial [Pseudolycoriella hygida]
VTEETCEILQTFGYAFEQRGLVAVKGKGQLMTYYLQGKTTRQNSLHSSPILAAINPMETLPEMDESKESTPPNEQTGSLLPSISSSSNSPNSVK